MNKLRTLLSEKRILKILWNYKRKWLIQTKAQMTNRVKADIIKLCVEIIENDKKIADCIKQISSMVQEKGRCPNQNE